MDGCDIFMKYTRGLVDYICKELKLFSMDTIEDAIMKAIITEAKNKRLDKKDKKSKLVNKYDWKSKGKKKKEG